MLFITQYAGFPTTSVAAQIETLDFSMPSYDSATKDSKAPAPLFNPFGDFEPEFKSAPAPAPVDDSADKAAAEAKAAADAKKAEEKAAADAKKAEEKAAAEAKKAEVSG